MSMRHTRGQRRAMAGALISLAVAVLVTGVALVLRPTPSPATPKPSAACVSMWRHAVADRNYSRSDVATLTGILRHDRDGVRTLAAMQARHCANGPYSPAMPS